jgi:hypothetical protein
VVLKIRGGMIEVGHNFFIGEFSYAYFINNLGEKMLIIEDFSKEDYKCMDIIHESLVKNTK